jgi:hypothetical protein
MIEQAALEGQADSDDQRVQLSIAISLKRIADAFDSSESGGRVQGSVLWWLESIASAANAGRSQ